MLPYPLKKHQLDQEVNPTSPPIRRRHTHRDAYNRFYKPTVRWRAEPSRLLDGFALLDAAKVEHPEEVVTARLSGEHLCRVEQQDLRYFVNLAVLSVPDNHLRLEDLGYLTALVDLDLMCNRIKAVGEVSFLQLQTLNISYNSLKQEDILRLAKATPRLVTLDLAENELERLPADLSGFKCLRTLSLAGNHLASEELFRSLSTLPWLLKLDLARNSLPGVHGESVASLKQLEELDFSHNRVHSAAALLSVVSLPALQVLVISGNPLELREVEKLSATTRALMVNTSGGKPAKPAYPRPVAIVTHKPSSAPVNNAICPAGDYRSSPQPVFVTTKEHYSSQVSQSSLLEPHEGEMSSRTKVR